MKISNWWNDNMNDEMLSTFKGWVGDFNTTSKKIVREYTISKKYESLLDVGCGLCDTYYGYKNDNYEIKYTGLDSCEYFIKNAKEKNIDIIESDMNNINIKDESFDIVYGRHILEHLPTYKPALSEFIRISKRETIIIFFIKPQDKEYIHYNNGNDLYHNIYSKKDIEQFLKSYEISWEEVKNESDPNLSEMILYIKKPILE